MNRVALILLSIAAIAADDNKRFAPGPAASIPTRQTSEKITIAAVPFTSEEQAKSAFGKVNPYKEGFLPVLVVIDNGTGRALRLNLAAEYVDAGDRHVEATAASDVVYGESGPRQPRMPGTSPNPIPNPLPRKPKKKALDTWEIEGRAFSAKMLPAGESVYGFFYFRVRHLPGSKLYLTGLRDAASNREYFYFDIPLDAPKSN